MLTFRQISLFLESLACWYENFWYTKLVQKKWDQFWSFFLRCVQKFWDDRDVSWSSLFFSSETETLNNFCPSRFSEVCPDFYFLQIANLERHFFLQNVYRFAFLMKIEIWTHLRNSSHTLCQLRLTFINNANLCTLEKIWTLIYV